MRAQAGMSLEHPSLSMWPDMLTGYEKLISTWIIRACSKKIITDRISWQAGFFAGQEFRPKTREAIRRGYSTTEGVSSQMEKFLGGSYAHERSTS